MTCDHFDFEVHAAVGRITANDDTASKVVGYSAEITIRCGRCNLPFVFMGLPVGVLPRGAATNVDGTELRAGIAPQGSVPTMLDECEQVGFLIHGGVPS